MATAPTPAGSAPRRRLLGRWTTPQDQVEAAELMEDSLGKGATTISGCKPGEKAVIAGTLRSVTLRPREGVPALEAELYDGSGRITLVWLGRRRIRGIEPGRMLVATGRLTCADVDPVIYNPRYTLRPRTGE